MVSLLVSLSRSLQLFLVLHSGFCASLRDTGTDPGGEYTYVYSEHKNKSVWSGVVYGMVGGFAVFVFIFLVGVIYIKRRYLWDKARALGRCVFEICCGNTEADLENGEECPQDSIEMYPTKAMSKGELGEYISGLELDSQRGLEEEFAHLKELTRTHPSTEANEDINGAKNRFLNIRPYDYTRVVLHSSTGLRGSDYINANYINDIDGKASFIASQGPKSNTVEDFWRMVWQLNCLTIVMLTKLAERAKEKCYKYWPDQGKVLQAGDFTITSDDCETESNLFVIRQFSITKNSNVRKEREVKQFHFKAWPDFGAPKHENRLLGFIKTIKSHTRVDIDNNSPLVVHCSAGVGRTGTFIGLWNNIDSINRQLPNPKIDVYRTVLEMRDCRPMMVQSREQYLYLCKCIFAYMKHPERWQVPTSTTDDGAYCNTGYESDLSSNL